MGRRPTARIESVAEMPAEYLAQPAPLPVKLYPRFIWLLDRLEEKWEANNRSATMRRCLDLYTQNPERPLDWMAARPRRPRAPRVENPVRNRRLQAEEEPVPQVNFTAVLTIGLVDRLTSWAEIFSSNRTAVMCMAVWVAAITEGLVDPKAPVDLKAPGE